jgi:tRNA A-37 threonylcarbamoyl transferase component Bud32
VTSLNLSACPDARELERILLGQVALSDEEAARLEKHLTECPRCNDGARSLGIDLLAPTEIRPVLQNLLSQRQEQLAAARTAQPEATPAPERQTADLHEASSVFLAPAREPGELGRLGSYRVLRVLGAGGMGFVFEAEDPQLKRRIALKVMRPELAANEVARQRFLREAQAQAALEHDHIIPIYQVNTEGRVAFLAMPLLRGETLHARLVRDKVLPTTEALRIAREIAEGLATAHEAGLIHRDIKPANIWLETERSRVKILDFGLARADADDAHLTRTGTITGTPAYMAPEQAAGEKVDHRCDLFSLGSVLYQMGTGQLPFPGSNPMTVLRALAVEMPKPMRDLNPAVPPALANLTLRLLAKKPQDRPQTAGEVVVALAAIEKEPAPKPSHARRWWFAAAAVVLLALGVTGWLYSAAVYRFATNQGVVVIQTDDPDVEVTVRGDVVKIVDVKTSNELTLKAGKYQLELTRGKDGLKLSTSEFTLERGGKQIVKVTREAATPAREPFVVLSEGQAERKFSTLTDAFAAAQNGNVIEIRGDGPFVLRPLDLGDKPLTLRAGKGHRPLLALDREGAKANQPLLTTGAALVLEGLELHRDGDDAPAPGGRRFIYSRRGPVVLVNCRIVLRSRAKGLISAVRADEPSSVQVRNCLFLGDWYAGMDWQVRPDARAVVANCLFLTGHHAVNVSLWSAAPNASVRLLNNTILSRVEAVSIQFNPPTAPGPAPRRTAVPLEARRNACSSGLLHFACWANSREADGITERELRSQSRQLLALEDQGNRLGADPDLVRFAVICQPGGYSRRGTIATLDEWRDFCKPGNTDAVVGRMPFQGPDLSPEEAEPERLSPEDFRLRPDRPETAGEGADVDLVGPGPGYERWQKTPQYQEWRRAASVAERPNAAPTPFVILARPGSPARDFASLADAVAGAENGDTIEIRGNGPFTVPPLNLKDKALTIRAGAGYVPVFQLVKEELPPGTPMLHTEAAVVLEGLVLRRDDRGREKTAPLEWMIESSQVPLRLANCRFEVALQGYGGVVSANNSPHVEVRNCLLLDPTRGSFLGWGCPSGGKAILDNNVAAGGITTDAKGFLAFHDTAASLRDVSLRLSHNTIVVRPYTLFLDYVPTSSSGGDAAFHLDAAENVYGMPGTMFAFSQIQDQYVTGTKTLPAAEAETLLRSRFAWREQRNVFPDSIVCLYFHAQQKSQEPTRPRTTLAHWNELWRLKEAGSIQGRVRFRGGDVRARVVAGPEQMTPEDFCLEAGSAGFHAGPDGRDLGADIDLVGPGAAYERWQKTPEYLEWKKQIAPK